MLKSIKVLHVESTDACNAACPLCLRETDVEFDKSDAHHLTIEQILKVIDEPTIANLDKMYMCGVYGDPAAGKHTLEIYDYFRKINPNISFGMNTNGSIKDPQWWSEMASFANNQKDYVVFSLDGLADTNHIYRVNTNWNKIIKNIEAFISAGGRAHWDMLIYKHNEHQVEQAQQLAKYMGFKWFRAKVSNRPLADNLEYPVNWNKVTPATGRIDCRALKEQSIYIDAQGRISPCCWLGARQSDFITDIEQVRVTWDTTTPNKICTDTCSILENNTNFENQWRYELALSD
jgi:sulfatase maturation enzyme AslB (radical SAM superfamily)